MRDAYAEAGRLLRQNALHRKGFRLQEISCEAGAQHAIDELNEYVQAKTKKERKAELADVFGILLAQLHREGLRLEEIEYEIQRKWRIRFPSFYPKPSKETVYLGKKYYEDMDKRIRHIMFPELTKVKLVKLVGRIKTPKRMPVDKFIGAIGCITGKTTSKSTNAKSSGRSPKQSSKACTAGKSLVSKRKTRSTQS